MGEWLSSLKNLLDIKNVIKLTLPGLLGAVVLAAIFWPPKPIDIVPVVTSTPPPMGDGKALGNGIGKYLGRVHQPVASGSQCLIAEYGLDELPSGIRSLLPGFKREAQLRQFGLEQQRDNLEQCLLDEQRLKGEEQSRNAALQRDLQALEALRDKDASSVAEYERQDSPMIDPAIRLRENVNGKIDTLRDKLSGNEQKARDREWDIAELTKWKGVVTDRLTDPGKLRPELEFDEYMSALSNHLLAFIFLAVTVGMITEAIVTPGILEMIESFVFRS